MRVLTATGIMNAGGAESLIMELFRHKSERVEHILLVHYDDQIVEGVYDDEIRELGIPIIHIPSVGSIGIQRYLQEFKKVVQRIGKIDVLHSHLNAVGGIICMAAQKSGIKSRIVHCHADITYKGSTLSIMKQEFRLCFMKLCVKRYATAYWACSEQAARRLFGSKAETSIIPNVIDVKKYLACAQKREKVKERLGFSGRRVIGAIGRIARIKNYEFIIKILASMDEYEFVCFGRTTDEQYFSELLGLSTRLGVRDRVHFLGNSENIASDISCFDLFVMPSISEGFGIAALEAQAAGLMTYLSTGVPNIVDVGLGLVQFLPLDVEKWKNAICKAEMKNIDNEQIISAFDRAGYNSESMVRQIEERYLFLMR